MSPARGILDGDEIGSRVPFSGTVARQVMERDREAVDILAPLADDRSRAQFFFTLPRAPGR